MSDAVEAPASNLIPHGWSFSPIGNHVTSWAVGPRFPGSDYDNDGNVATLRTTDMDDDGKLTLRTMPRASLNLRAFGPHFLQPNDLVISRSGTCGVAALFPGFELPVVPGAFLLRFRFTSDVEPVFLRYLFNSRVGRDRLLREAEGGVQKNIRGTSVLRVQILLPPLPHQRKIARILTTVDNLIEKTEALIAKYQAIKQGMMHDLFTRGVDEHGHLRPPYEEAPELYKQSELGWIPKEWSVIQARHFCHEITKGATPPDMHDEPGLSNVPFIRVQNLSFDGTLLFDDQQLFIPAFVHQTSLVRSKVFPGDVLMNLVGPPMGKVSLVPETYPEWNINQAIAIFRTIDASANVFLSHFLLSQFAFKWFISRAKRTSGQTNLTLEMCRQLPVPNPNDVNERIRITGLLNNAETRLVSENAVLTKLQRLTTGLMQDLLTGRVRVKMDKAEEVAAHA